MTGYPVRESEVIDCFVICMQLRRPSGEEGEEQEEEDRCVSVIANLLLALQRGTRRDRVAAKFVENEFEKCDRLLEIYLRLIQHVQAEEVRPCITRVSIRSEHCSSCHGALI